MAEPFQQWTRASAGVPSRVLALRLSRRALALCVPALLVSSAYAADFQVKNINVGHPANSDLLHLKGSPYLVVAGHDSEKRWCSLVDAQQGTVKQIPILTNAQFFEQATLALPASASPAAGAQPAASSSASADTAANSQTSSPSQLVALATDGIWRFDLASMRWSQLHSVSSMYPVVDKKRFKTLDMVLDVNKDGLSDFLIPDFTAYHLLVQQADGRFGQFDLPIASQSILFTDGPTYSAKTPQQADINLDGRLDIGFAQDDSIRWYLQQTDGSFAKEPQVQQLGVGLTPDLQAQQRAGDGRSFTNLALRLFERLQDLNNDQIPDLVVQQAFYKDAMDQQYSYQIHYGQKPDAGGFVQFNKTPDQKINTNGVQFEVQFQDLDGDGRADFFTPVAEIGLSKIVSALLTGSADIDYQFFRQREDGSFGERPVYRQDITVGISINSGQVNMPVATVLKDKTGVYQLLIGDGESTLRSFGHVGAKLFSEKSRKFDTPLPKRGMTTLVTDLNQDGAEDLVLPFTSQEEKAEWTNQISILIQQ